MRALTTAMLLGLLAFGSGAAVKAHNSRLAWPRFAMFYGGLLEDRRAFLLDQEDVVALTASFRLVPRGTSPDLESRRHVQVALYWNNYLWDEYLASPDRRSELPLPSVPWTLPPSSVTDPARFVEPARFYPATADEPALFEHLGGARPGVQVVGEAGLELLQEHGVPVNVTAWTPLRREFLSRAGTVRGGHGLALVGSGDPMRPEG